MRRLIVGLAVVFTCTEAITADAAVIVNGGFETGNLNGWTWYPYPDASASVVMFDVYGEDGASFAFQVNPTLAARGTVGNLSQWLVLEGGTSYTVSWEQGVQNVGTSPADVGEIAVRLGSQLLHRWGSGGGGALGANGYTSLSEAKVFTPTVTDTYELSFLFVRYAFENPPTFMYVDNIRVFDPNAIPDPNVVPEPASILVWSILCIVGFVIVRRRRRHA